MPALSATAQVLNNPPRVQIALTGATGTTATVMRVTPDGTQTPVRTANPATLVAGAWNGYDYEAPFGVEITYQCQSVSSGVVNLDPQVPWLIHPGQPALSVPLTVESLGKPTRPTSAGVHQPLGRATAIVISDGVRRAGSYDLGVRTDTIEDEAALVALLGLDATMLLQINYGNGIRRSVYDWVAVGDAVPTASKSMAVERVQWLLPCTVTDAPVGLLQSQWTYSGLAAAYTNYAQVAAAFATYQGVALNTPGA